MGFHLESIDIYQVLHLLQTAGPLYLRNKQLSTVGLRQSNNWLALWWKPLNEENIRTFSIKGGCSTSCCWEFNYIIFRRSMVHYTDCLKIGVGFNVFFPVFLLCQSRLVIFFKLIIEFKWSEAKISSNLHLNLNSSIIWALTDEVSLEFVIKSLSFS